MDLFHRIEQVNNFITALRADFIYALIAFFVIFVIFVLTNTKKQYKPLDMAIFAAIMAILLWMALGIYSVSVNHNTEGKSDSQITFN